MLNQIYLTIDDTPSIHTKRKVDTLLENNIPAIFYARGEYIEKHPYQLIYAIKKGFLIGNHSYSHPYFSKIRFDKCVHEILATEKLIDACYSNAGVERARKIIRLPFADRGAGPKAKKPTTPQEKMKVERIQNFLKSEGFEKLFFPGLNHTDQYIDSFWDWDVEDYKSKHMQNPQIYESKLHDFIGSFKSDRAVLMLHDFDDNQELFDITLKFLLPKKINFLNI